MITNYGMKS